jgi:UPF0755 protein
LFVLIFAAGAWLGQGLIHITQEPIIQADNADQIVTEPVVIEPGSSFSQMATNLADRGIVERPLLLRVWARLNGYANRIQVGEYAIEPGVTVAALVKKMTQGQVVEYPFTIIEGWTIRTLLTELQQDSRIKNTLGRNPSLTAVMRGIDRAGVPAEGQFLPETYYFPKDSRDIDILRRANRALEAELNAAWAQRADNLPIESAQQALILASIIEKETAVADERRRVAGVFSRRLQRGMRLQTDPTVIYGMGAAFDGDLRRRDLRTDTPYNTYTRHGLPPTPIALAGAASIRAAVNPAAGDSVYFVSRGDGTHVFSATLEAHNAAVRRYQLGITD